MLITLHNSNSNHFKFRDHQVHHSHLSTSFPSTMRPLTPTSSAAMLRLCPRRMPIRPSVLATSLPSQHQQAPQQQQQTRSKASATGAEYDRQTPAFASPFKSASEKNDTTKIPSFANYMSKRGETSNKTFQYFMVGGMGLLTAAGAKATVQGMFSWAR